jgi:hypothetical protein
VESAFQLSIFSIARLLSIIALDVNNLLRHDILPLRESSFQVASMLQYPLAVHIADKTSPVHNPDEFLRNYSRIVNRSVKAAILDEKSSRCLFSNPDGFMIGDGEVWFREISSAVFKIITFNLD